jgi:alginate O-acetyltransferase complex protein AlgI
MLFNTVQFAIFYAIVAAMHFTMPARFRSVWLLAASYVFYIWSGPKYILVIAAITLIDYAAGIGIEKAQGAMRRFLLAASVVSNFGLLFVFKYADFFGSALGIGLNLHRALPLGISFHTFQAVSYTVEVYRSTVRAERNLRIYALYVAFFPQMVAGPIERPQNLLPQLRRPKPFERVRFTSGLRIALRGLIKKAVVADLAAPAVNTVYAHPRAFSGPILALATALFAVQIYCDFSGYSDMAVGLARILGYDLTLNFRQPYFAQSVAEFWRRWHISLSTWFRDYLYIPLGGNRASRLRWSLNIMIVFLLSGLWHGANWTFVAWGALHGFYFLFDAATSRLRTPIAFVRIAVTNFFVGTAWIFFRAANLSDAAYIVSHLFDFNRFQAEDLFRLGLPRFEMALLGIVIAAVFAAEYLSTRSPAWLSEALERRAIRWPLYAAAAYTVVFFGVFGHVEFIYFRF